MKRRNFILVHANTVLRPLICLLVLAAAGTAAAQPAAPAARERPRTGISGYMEAHLNNVEFEDAQLDFHRFVLLFTHEFTERIRFVGELELEHALVEGLEDAGELELEQAYLDFLLARSFNVRAGMMLMPIGIINERHEPPSFYGTERPFVDTVIVPTTWFDVGAGVHGELGEGWRYRAFLTAPLDASAFTAEEGLRDGRQKGSQSNLSRIATTGRVEYVAQPGLTLGASFWTGDSGFAFQPAFGVPVRVAVADARYGRERLDLRGQFAQVWVDNASELNDALARGTGVNPNIARALRGYYGEAGYRFFTSPRVGELGAFVRYESFDTQYRMPEGYVPLLELDRDAWVFGAAYWPDPDISIKVDYSAVRSRSGVIRAPDSLNAGVGWWF